MPITKWHGWVSPSPLFYSHHRLMRHRLMRRGGEKDIFFSRRSVYVSKIPAHCRLFRSPIPTLLQGGPLLKRGQRALPPPGAGARPAAAAAAAEALRGILSDLYADAEGNLACDFKGKGGRKEVRNDLEVWPTALAVKRASRQIARETTVNANVPSVLSFSGFLCRPSQDGKLQHRRRNQHPSHGWSSIFPARYEVSNMSTAQR